MTWASAGCQIDSGLVDKEDEGPKFTQRGRFGRFLKFGGMAASVTSSMVGHHVTRRLRSEEAQEEALRTNLLGNAQKMVRAMGELKGAAMKLGQMLSVLPDHLPDEIRSELAALQKDTPPMPYELVAKQFEKGTGIPLPEAFRVFNPEPVGAASIGQVHRATLFDGTEVAVKVQYPGILATLDSDLKNLGSLMQMGRVVADKDRLDAILAELKEGILGEADYGAEAGNLETYGAIFSAHPDVVVPKVVRDYCSDTVLTMEFLAGDKLDVAIAALPEAERDAVALKFTRIFMWMFHEKQLLHADPHPGNFLLMPDGRIGLLDFGCVRTYKPEFCDLWLEVMAAKFAHDKQRLPGIFERLGYKGQKGSKGLSAQQLHELTEITCAPFLYDRDFDWAKWKPRKALEDFTKANLNLMKYAAPPEAVFYFRVAGGVWGLLAAAGVKANFHRIAKEMIERRGIV